MDHKVHAQAGLPFSVSVNLMMLGLKVEEEMRDDVLQNFYPNQDDDLHKTSLLLVLNPILCVQLRFEHVI